MTGIIICSIKGEFSEFLHASDETYRVAKFTDFNQNVRE